MKKTLLCSGLLLLGLMLGAGMAVAAPVPGVPEAPLCAVQAPSPLPAVVAVQAPTVDLFLPASQPAAICPLIGCVNDQYCRRDRDCTAAPGGVCNLFCPTQGCCSYPAQ
jgi:hypothetical protein